MKEKTARSDSQVPILQVHLIFEQILPRLPVKSLIRFKSVSKYWLSRISSHEFAKIHLNFSPSCSQVLLQENDFMYDNSFFVSFDECNNNVKECVKLERKFRVVNLPDSDPAGGVNSTCLVDSCNGLVCLFDDDVLCFYIWNPAANQCHNVYRPDFDYEIEGITGLGFGYVSSIDDYRIVCLLCHLNSCYVYIFSSRARKWKIMGKVNSNFKMGRPDMSVLIDDTVYWPPVVPGYGNEGNYIVGLNLVSGELMKFPLKSLLIGYDKVKVYRMKGCLSLCCAKYVNGSYSSRVSDVWMLKQDGDWDSWEKIFSINVGGTDLIYLFEMGKCLVTKNNQTKLLDPSEVAPEQYEEGTASWQGSEDGTNLIGYNPYRGHAWGYVESLISPFETVVDDGYAANI